MSWCNKIHLSGLVSSFCVLHLIRVGLVVFSSSTRWQRILAAAYFWALTVHNKTDWLTYLYLTWWNFLLLLCFTFYSTTLVIALYEDTKCTRKSLHFFVISSLCIKRPSSPAVKELKNRIRGAQIPTNGLCNLCYSSVFSHTSTTNISALSHQQLPAAGSSPSWTAPSPPPAGPKNTLPTRTACGSWWRPSSTASLWCSTCSRPKETMWVGEGGVLSVRR